MEFQDLPAAKRPKLSPAAATRMIRERARVSANVILTFHAQEQMAARDIAAPEVFRILREGAVFQPPVLTAEAEWKSAIEMRMPGGHDVAVVTVLRHAATLVVVTVMWRDLS